MLSCNFRSVLRFASTIALGLAVLGISVASYAQTQQADRFRGIVKPIVAKKPIRIGVTLVHLKDDFWKGIAYGIVDEAKRSNVEVVQVSVAGAYGNVTAQFGQLRTLQSLGSDVVVVGAAAFDGYNAILKRLKKSGITVIAAGIPVNSSSVAFGVAQDDKAIGVTLGDIVCKAKGAAKAAAITIPGPAGAEWARLRNVGFLERAKECPGLTVVKGTVGGSLSLEDGLAQSSDLLLRTPDARFIFTPQISLGMGAAQAVKQLNKTDVDVVTSAVVREAIPMLKEGRLLAVVSEPGILIGRLIVQYAIRKEEGLPMPRLSESASLPYPVLTVPNKVITTQDASTYPFDVYDLPPKDWSIKAIQ